MIALGTWLSDGSDLFPEGHWIMSRNIFDFHNMGEGVVAIVLPAPNG